MIPRHLLIGVTIMFLVALTMGFYLWRMRKRVAPLEAAAVTASSGPAQIAPPASGPTEQATLFVAYDDSGVLRQQAVRIPLPSGRQQRAQELLRSLISVYADKPSPHSIAPGSEIRQVYLVDPGLAVIDLNGAFASGHHSGILIEELSVVSMIETLSMNIPGINQVKILVDGKERDALAGHADLSGVYDVSQVNQLADLFQNP
ncbi:MAG: GerMN domain-containing protein [Acidobacteriales bacterium]|nr:GerMN domain-containing protein [Terriglobales bacterium]